MDLKLVVSKVVFNTLLSYVNKWNEEKIKKKELNFHRYYILYARARGDY